MSFQAMGKVPPYQDISHFRAPYKNAIFAGLGAAASAGQPTVGSGPVGLYFYSDAQGTWYTTSVDPVPPRRVVHLGTVMDAIKGEAGSLARAFGRDVYVYQSAGPQGPVGRLVYIAYAHGVLSAMQGLGTDPMACVAPKWVYSGFSDSCVCAPGYVSTHDGSDCIPLVDPTTQVPPTGGLWNLVDPVTGATSQVDPGTPGATPPTTTTPTATTPAACAGYQVGSTCVPSWALWVGGGLAAILVIDMVL